MSAEAGQLWVHVATNRRYVVIGTAILQLEGHSDMAQMVVYRGEDGRQWVRLVLEFAQRFHQI